MRRVQDSDNDGLMLSSAERKILAALIDLASETLSNEGCNDFDPVKLKLASKEEWEELRDKIQDSGVFGDEDDEDFFAMDYLLLDYFSMRLKGKVD